MNAKRKGNRNERRTRDWYLDKGATYVVKAGGSLGLYDLVVFWVHHVDFVQVKTNRWPSPRERAAMLEPMARLPDNSRFVQDQAGHSSPKTTAIYAKTNNKGRQRQVEALDDD